MELEAEWVELEVGLEAEWVELEVGLEAEWVELEVGLEAEWENTNKMKQRYSNHTLHSRRKLSKILYKLFGQSRDQGHQYCIRPYP